MTKFALFCSFVCLTFVPVLVHGYVNLTEGWKVSPIADRNAGFCAMQRALLLDLSDVSFVVIKNGEIAAEAYQIGHFEKEHTQVWSTTKSWSSMIIGHLITNGKLSLDMTLGDIFNNEAYWDGVGQVTEKQGITLKEILTFTSGLTEEIFTGTITEVDQETLQQVLDAVEYSKDGRGSFFYLASSHLVSRIILQVSGMTPREYAVESGIFESLGIKENDYDWQTFGEVEGSAYGFRSNPRTQAKLGMLFLQNGYASDDLQLIDSDYIEAARTNQLEDGEYTSDALFGIGPYFGYGYNWWTDLEVDNVLDPLGDFEGAYAALGFLGQEIVVLPKLDIVIAIVSDFQDPLNMLWVIFNNLDQLDEEEDCADLFSSESLLFSLGDWFVAILTSFVALVNQKLEVFLDSIR